MWKTISSWAAVVGLFAAVYAAYPRLDCELGRMQEAQAEGPVCAELHPVGERSLGWGTSGACVLLAVAARFFAARARRPRRSPARELVPGGYTGDRRSMETSSRAGSGNAGFGDGGSGRRGVPEAITISQEFEIDLPGDSREEDVEALINYLEEEEHALLEQDEKRQKTRQSPKTAAVDGFYCPPGLEDAPVFYVDPEHGAASDVMDALDERADNPERPFVTIQAALDRAQKLFMSTRGPVQVRVMPGVYQEKLFVPGHVSLVNHRLPAEGSIRQHLDWLVAQQEVDDPDRVTILAPPDAEFAVKFEPGQRQGLFGCHLVGREGVRQQGVVAEHCTSLALVHCSVEDFSAGGLHMNDCGGSAPKTATQIVGCRFRNNRSLRGAAAFMRGGAMHIEKTRFEKNRAAVGGAVFATDLRSPLVLQEVGFRANEASSKDRLAVRPDVVELEDWLQGSGQGGAVCVVRSKAKLAGCKFIDNTATTSGGALALLGARAVLESRGSGNTFRQNRARVGGAVFMAGWMGGRATIKARGVKFSDNLASSDGGALALLGFSAAQWVETRFTKNEAQAREGVGGAVAALKGGQFMAKETRFRANKSAGRGGAVGAINASVVLSDGCIVEENIAEGGEGGGVSCVSRSSVEMEQLMNRSDFKLPFVFTMRDVAVRNNRSAGQTAGVVVGNEEEVSTFPVKVTIEKPMFVRNNRATAGSERTSDLIVRWRREVVADGGERVRRELLLN